MQQNETKWAILIDKQQRNKLQKFNEKKGKIFGDEFG